MKRAVPADFDPVYPFDKKPPSTQAPFINEKKGLTEDPPGSLALKTVSPFGFDGSGNLILYTAPPLSVTNSALSLTISSPLQIINNTLTMQTSSPIKVVNNLLTLGVGQGLTIDNNNLTIDPGNALELKANNKLQLKAIIPDPRTFTGEVKTQSVTRLAVNSNRGVLFDTFQYANNWYTSMKFYSTSASNLIILEYNHTTNKATLTGNNLEVQVEAPTTAKAAANKTYVDNQVASLRPFSLWTGSEPVPLSANSEVKVSLSLTRQGSLVFGQFYVSNSSTRTIEFNWDKEGRLLNHPNSPPTLFLMNQAKENSNFVTNEPSPVKWLPSDIIYSPGSIINNNVVVNSTPPHSLHFKTSESDANPSIITFFYFPQEN